ncbi:MAG: hypothetical protein HQM07_09225, partial [Zetaproteobacteria bacterium]|nr:hypothetical protein [Zetaproteobacteria bacterium]
ELYQWVSERMDQQLRQRPEAILVEGEGRTDMPTHALWRAVGNSPMRDAARQMGGIPEHPGATVAPQQAQGQPQSARRIIRVGNAPLQQQGDGREQNPQNQPRQVIRGQIKFDR